MTWIADAHREWHTVNGRYAVCPLDCGAAEALYAEAEEEAEHGTIRCAHCKGRHWNVGRVKACAALNA